MAKTPAKRRGHEFTPDEIDRALTALALTHGNGNRALELLAQDTTLTRTPSPQVLSVWRRKHAQRYEEIRLQQAPRVEAAIVHDYRAIASRAAQVALEGVEQTAAGLKDLDAKDASAAVKNLGIVAGVATDKLLVLTDRPNVITERREPAEILRQIDSITGYAEEIEDSASELPLAASGSTNVRELGPPPLEQAQCKLP